MKCKTACRLSLVLLLPAVAMGQSESSENSIVGPAIEIAVYDSAGVPPQELQSAQAHATVIFALAGVPLEWTTCAGADSGGTRCGKQPGPSQITLRLVRRPAGRKVAFAANTGGVAIRATREGGSGYITIYYDRVEVIAERVKIRRRRVLGHAMAHEIGHILLPVGSHARTGIMRERLEPEDWRAAEMGRLLFTAQQAETMRAGFTTRARAALQVVAARKPREE